MRFVENRKRILEFLKERFGIEEDVFNEVEFVETRKAIWMVPSEFKFKENQMFLHLKKLNFAGLRLLRKTGPDSFKPTTYALQLIGKYATKNTIEIERDVLKKLLDDGYVKLDSSTTTGFVIVRYKGLSIGCALLKDGILYNQFPKGRVEAIKNSDLF